jgi:hypothetical protein
MSVTVRSASHRPSLIQTSLTREVRRQPAAVQYQLNTHQGSSAPWFLDEVGNPISYEEFSLRTAGRPSWPETTTSCE